MSLITFFSFAWLDQALPFFDTNLVTPLGIKLRSVVQFPLVWTSMYGLAFLCAVFVLYRLIRLCCKYAIPVIFIIGSLTLLLLGRAIFIAIPIWYDAFVSSFFNYVQAFDSTILEWTAATTSSTIRPVALPISYDSDATGSAIFVTTTLVFSSVVLYVISKFIAWAQPCVVTATNPSSGAITRNHTRYEQDVTSSAPMSGNTPTTSPICAPATNEPLYDLLKVILQSNHSTNTQSDPAFQQHFSELKSELLSLIHREFATITSSLTLTLPSATLIAQLVEDAVARAIADLPKGNINLDATEKAVPTRKVIATPDLLAPSIQLCTLGDSHDDKPTVNAANAWRTVRNKLSKKTHATPAPLNTPKPEDTAQEIDMRTVDELTESDL